MKGIQAVAGSDEYQARIGEIEDNLRDYQENPRLVQSPEELERVEREIGELADELAALVTGRQIQHSLDSEQLQEAQRKLVTDWPHRLKNHESEGVWVRTASGYEIWVKARYFRRTGDVQARGGIEASISDYSCWESTSAVPRDLRPR